VELKELSSTHCERPRIRPSQSWPMVSGNAPLRIPLRREDALARPKSQEADLSAYTVSYRLLEEARKSWNQIISNEVVYFLDVPTLTFDAPKGIAKDYLKGQVWIECHVTFQLRFKPKRDIHYIVILEAGELRNTLRKLNPHRYTVSGNPHVLVNVAHFVESPKKVALLGVPSVIRLKAFNDGHCLCGYSSRASLNQFGVGLLKDGELGILGIRQLQFCETPNELVQRGTEIVKNISNNKRNSVGNVLDPKFDSAALIFRIVIDNESTWLSFAESLHFFPQSVKVFFRPGGLKIGISQAHA
jgi:hypothetical protein